MAQSSGRVGTAEAKEQFDSAQFRDSSGKYAYHGRRDEGTYYFEFQQQDTKQPIQGRRPLEYFVGSGNAAHSYLINVDGFLYEPPVAYYRNLASWKAAPGFAQFDYPYLTRPSCRDASSVMRAGFGGSRARKTLMPRRLFRKEASPVSDATAPEAITSPLASRWSIRRSWLPPRAIVSASNATFPAKSA
jgi:hypothetical protein